jgi:putative Mg2+ transporter-C (MgtC) family protein
MAGMIDWQQVWLDFTHLGGAFLLTIPIGWNRERETHNTGIRAFPIVGMASCGFLMLAAYHSDQAAVSRVLQGLITGIGFVGGGAIVKDGANARGTATAASVWCAGAIGTSVAMDRWGISIILTVLNLIALKAFKPLKEKLDRVEDSVG